MVVSILGERLIVIRLGVKSRGDRMKLAILGASVSAQKANYQTGEVTGYQEVLRYEAGSVGISEVMDCTYPGNRASDGGLICSQFVADGCPDICIFEPNVEDRSRGVHVVEDEILFIYSVLVNSNIKPILLLLPTGHDLSPKTRPDYDIHFNVARRLNVPIIEIDLSDERDSARLFRGVHTSPEGARIYAHRIMIELERMLAEPRTWSALPEHVPTRTILQRVPYEARGEVRDMRFMISFDASDGPEQIRIIQKQEIGPFSPVIDVAVDGRVERSSVWDPYCHYARQSYVTIFNASISSPAELEVSVSAQDPEYDRCRREGASFPPPEHRYMSPRGDIYLVSQTQMNLKVC